jgi:hypothetical protein
MEFNMPHYDRHADPSAEQNDFEDVPGGEIDEEAAEVAAEAMRQADLESAQEEFDISSLKAADLESMSIDQLRVIARQLDVPDRGKITEQDELIAEVKKRL